MYHPTALGTLVLFYVVLSCVKGQPTEVADPIRHKQLDCDLPLLVDDD